MRHQWLRSPRLLVTPHLLARSATALSASAWASNVDAKVDPEVSKVVRQARDVRGRRGGAGARPARRSPPDKAQPTTATAAAPRARPARLRPDEPARSARASARAASSRRPWAAARDALDRRLAPGFLGDDRGETGG